MLYLHWASIEKKNKKTKNKKTKKQKRSPNYKICDENVNCNFCFSIKIVSLLCFE